MTLPPGHQKKLMLAVRRLAELQKAEYAKYEGGPLRRKAPQSLDVMAMESPPPAEPAPADVQSPKMTTFQDSELSGPCQAFQPPATHPQGQRAPGAWPGGTGPAHEQLSGAAG